MADFEDVLRANGLQFSHLLDEKGKEDILSFWSAVSSDVGGTLSDAELDSILDTYRGIGVIEPLGTPAGKRSPSAGESGSSPVAAGDAEGPLALLSAVLASGAKPSGREVPGSDNAAAASSQEKAAASPDPDLRRAKPQSAVTAGASREAAGSAVSPKEEAPAEASESADASTPAAPSYQLILSACHTASPEHPILVLADPEHVLHHHQDGDFTNPERRTAFECRSDALHIVPIQKLDKRFVKLLSWLGENHIYVTLSGQACGDGYAVYKIHAKDPNGNDTLQSANDSFLQLLIRRLLAGGIPEDRPEEEPDRDDHMLLTDMASMIDFLRCAGDTLPPDILSWAHRNIALVKTDTISPEEKRHAQRALSLMLNIQWKGSYFESIDPVEARRILDEELYGMEAVKQRVIETIIQINRTHTLPAYGLLLVGPAGTGKSQIAYAVARILKLPWTALDMSTIHDSEALTGSPRVYSNAKPGRIMEAFSQAGASNLVFIINELDKAESASSSGNPADALLTLLDNLGYTDNYIECVIPTGGVYPIATANDKSRISDPLLTRFAVIDIPDYTPEEKATIFTDFSLPKVLRRMGMNSAELSVTPEAVQVIVSHYQGRPGVRDLEQAAEHLAANALYQIETAGISHVLCDASMARRILGA